ncbi:hypothetical protein AREALGSMS7_02570 [Arenibacter algicola]|uniref:Uncharacterized protein n=1 Tax=Arenibacter algicola TaxID=616991 RepID=A0A221UXP6_9FLAO|nr:hypothetical protein AREALGSMS7_02570 [Arenibacter algicola]
MEKNIFIKFDKDINLSMHRLCKLWSKSATNANFDVYN